MHLGVISFGFSEIKSAVSHCRKQKGVWDLLHGFVPHDASVPIEGELHLLHTWISVWTEAEIAGNPVGLTATL